MRVSLGSVTENRHLASANQREISIGVVINLGHKNLRGALSVVGYRGLQVLTGCDTDWFSAIREPRVASREPPTPNTIPLFPNPEWPRLDPRPRAGRGRPRATPRHARAPQ